MLDTISISASAAAIFSADEGCGRPPPKREKDMVGLLYGRRARFSRYGLYAMMVRVVAMSDGVLIVVVQSYVGFTIESLTLQERAWATQPRNIHFTSSCVQAPTTHHTSVLVSDVDTFASRVMVRLVTLSRDVSPPPTRRNQIASDESSSKEEDVLQHGEPTLAAIEAGEAHIRDHLSYFLRRLSKVSRPVIDAPRLALSEFSELYRRSEHKNGRHFVVHQHDHPISGTNDNILALQSWLTLLKRRSLRFTTSILIDFHDQLRHTIRIAGQPELHATKSDGD